MKLTSDRVFLDTNVLVYSYSATEIDKQQTARKLVSEYNSYISSQVLQELCNIVTRKFNFSYPAALVAINESLQNNNFFVNTEHTIIQACKIAERYSFSFYDSMIISAALECECSVLYSEDLQHNQKIEELTIINPFRN